MPGVRDLWNNQSSTSGNSGLRDLNGGLTTDVRGHHEDDGDDDDDGEFRLEAKLCRREYGGEGHNEHS